VRGGARKTASGLAHRRVLAVDVGGTKVDLGVYSAYAGARQPLAERRYASADYNSLEALARAFLDDVGLEVEAACVDVAGPVTRGEARLTNLPWRLSEGSLTTALGVRRARLLNDLVAIASAIPVLLPDELQLVKAGEALADGPIAVIAPGTGLGEAFLVREVGGYRGHASEGGHVAFGPADDLQLELLDHLWQRFDHVSFERVASGVGIPHLYEFLRDRKGLAESEQLAAELAGTDDRTRPILTAGMDPSRDDELAQGTVELFLRILGGEAGNLALKVLATGGVYLAGGIAQALAGVLAAPPFLDAFTNAGRLTETLERVPVYVVKGEVALLGAATEGLKLLAGVPGAAP
jgi:glucokinase